MISVKIELSPCSYLLPYIINRDPLTSGRVLKTILLYPHLRMREMTSD